MTCIAVYVYSVIDAVISFNVSSEIRLNTWALGFGCLLLLSFYRTEQSACLIHLHDRILQKHEMLKYMQSLLCGWTDRWENIRRLIGRRKRHSLAGTTSYKKTKWCWQSIRNRLFPKCVSSKCVKWCVYFPMPRV